MAESRSQSSAPSVRPAAGAPASQVEQVSSRRCPSCGGRYPSDFKVCPHDATPLDEAPADDDDPLVGQRLGNTYEILRIIGEGGMGRVYEAQHTRLSNKRFAIKVLHHDLARQHEVVARFRREAEVASTLSHPNVVGVFDVTTAADGRPCIVAELLVGEQLGDRLEDRGKLSIPEAAGLVRQICRALAVAHDRGIVHRDIKPDNVFVVDGAAKVLDFGISKTTEAGPTLTKAGTVMGTPDYMPPEQARGDRVDHRADVYAAGAILYRAVTGYKPFEGFDPMGTLRALLTQEPPRPSSLDPQIPVELELVIQRAMAREPKERYQSAEELGEALAPFIEAPLEVSPEAPLVAGGPLEPTPKSAVAVETARTVRLARPGLVIFTALGFLWLLANVLVAVAAIIRLFRSADLTEAETVLALAGALFAIVTPAILWIRHVEREIWPSTPRSLEAVRRLQRTVLYSASSYGLGMLLVLLLETVVNRNAQNVARPEWTLVVFQIALVVGVATWMLSRPHRTR